MVPRYPRAIERAYMRALLAHVDESHQIALRAMDDSRAVMGLDPVGRSDDLTWLIDIVVNGIRTGLRRALGRPVKVEAVEDAAKQLGLFTARQVDQAVEVAARRAKVPLVPRVAPPAAGDVLFRSWVTENVALIRSIDQRYFADLEAVVSEALRKGTPTPELTKHLEARYQVSRSRARLIARDQVGKLNGQIAERRQRDLGVDRYEWVTSGDERVRDSHVALNGRVFLWSEPPAEGHPGQPIQCRCVARPVL